MKNTERPAKNSKYIHVLVPSKDQPLPKGEVGLYQLKPTGKMIPCPGEAHGNAFVDNCDLCAPNWGKVPEFAPVDLKRARLDGLAIRVSDLNQTQVQEEVVNRGARFAWCSKVLRKRPDRTCVSFMVIVYPNIKAIK